MSSAPSAPSDPSRHDRPPPRATAPAVAAVVASLLVLASALVVFLLRDTLTTRSVEGRPYAVASGAAGIATAGTGTTTPSRGPIAGTDPVAALTRQAAQDRSRVETFVGQWIPQISAKAPGLVVDGRTFDDAAVLADVIASRDRFPQALLLRSDDYTSFRRGGFWVTVVGTSFPTPQAANAWCDQHGLAPDDCFAKRLSHTEGPQGNTVPR